VTGRARLSVRAHVSFVQAVPGPRTAASPDSLGPFMPVSLEATVLVRAGVVDDPVARNARFPMIVARMAPEARRRGLRSEARGRADQERTVLSSPSPRCGRVTELLPGASG